jgi:dTMP kinase
MFVTFEGRDGGGKSTGALQLKENLEAKGFKVYLKHFPDYDSTIGGLIGDILAGKKDMPSFEALEMLYVADQLSFQKELETLLFDEKVVVICDRYDFSTLAYYISKTGCTVQDGVNLVYKKWQSEFRRPDITFIYDFKGDLDERRKDDSKEKDAIETDDVITNSINDVYLGIDKYMEYINDGRDTYIINADNSIEHNSKFILDTFEAESVFITKYMTNDREFKNKQIEPF